MMICLILLHDIVVADLDSHKCRVVNLDDDQQPPYMAVPQKCGFFVLSPRYYRVFYKALKQ